MPRKVWKAQVDHLGGSIDRCRERIDEMVQEENDQRSNSMNRLTEQYSKQVYNSGTGTTVTVSVKTRKPSTRSGANDIKGNSRLRHRSSSISRKHQNAEAFYDKMENDRGKNWDTLLSQDDHTESISPIVVKHRTQSLHGKPKIKEAAVVKSIVPQKRIKTSRSVTQRNAKVPVEYKQFAQNTKSSRAKEKPTGTVVAAQMMQEEVVRRLQLELEKVITRIFNTFYFYSNRGGGGNIH